MLLKMVTHPSTNQARRGLTWFMRRTPRRQQVTHANPYVLVIISKATTAAITALTEHFISKLGMPTNQSWSQE